jgi:hypothetical protein
MTDAIQRLAAAFSQAVREDLAPHLAEIRRRNREDYAGDTCCATHDFCDANMLMLDAITAQLGHEPRYLDGTDAAGDFDDEQQGEIDLWNAAWALAKAREFRL